MAYKQWVLLGLRERRRSGHIELCRPVKPGEYVTIIEPETLLAWDPWNYKKEYWEVMEVGKPRCTDD